MFRSMILVFVLALAATAQGDPATHQAPRRGALPDLKQARPQNGIDPAVAAEFWKKWTLLTVRYREDNGEQRFIYANDLAWQAIGAGRDVFPDGAMLAKIAFATSMDSAFPNSKEPSRYTRVQLMLKNSRQYPDTNGWGYALYVPDTVQKPEDDGPTQAACHACHRIVSQRDYVYSRSSFLAGEQWNDPDAAPFLQKFQPKALGDLPDFYQHLLATLQVKSSTVAYYSMPLFSGSLEESIGPLTTAVGDKGMPYLLAGDKDDNRLLLVVPAPSTPGCAKAVSVYLNTSRNGDKTPLTLKSGKSCGGTMYWDNLRAFPESLK